LAQRADVLKINCISSPKAPLLLLLVLVLVLSFGFPMPKEGDKDPDTGQAEVRKVEGRKDTL
jgi:hypothetical protein